MAVSSTGSLLLLAVALAGVGGGGVRAGRGRRRPLGAALLAVSLALGAWAHSAYRRACRLEEATQRFHAGLDEQRHGNLEEAERQYRAALSLNPGHPEARRALGEVSRPAATAPARQTRVQLRRGSNPTQPPPHPGLFHKPSDVEISDYTLDVALDPPRHGLRATAGVGLRARRDVGRIEMALSPEFTVAAVALNGAAVPFTHTNDLLILSSRLRRDGPARIEVRYARRSGKPLLQGGDLIDPRGVYLRPESRWYPSVGELDFHAPIAVSVRVPRGFTVVGAGRPAGKDAGASEVTYRWRSTESVRMICIAAGRYVYGRFADGPAPVETYLWAKHARKGPAYQKETARILRYYAGGFGPYPYAKLAIAEVPVYPGGYGSSSLLLLTGQSMAEKELPVSFLAHEIAHQWWGNRLAPAGKGAGWLSEAFAEYSAVLYQEHTGGPAALRQCLKELAYRYQSRRPGPEQAITETDPYDQAGPYTSVIYYKGAYVLHSLRGVTGEAAFRRILAAFMERYAGRRAGIADFEAVATEVYGQPLQWFFDQWLRRAGAPRFRYTVTTAAGQGTLTVAQDGEPYRGSMDVLIGDRAGQTRHRLALDGPAAQVRFPVNGEVTSVDLDPDNWWLKYTPRWVKQL